MKDGGDGDPLAHMVFLGEQALRKHIYDNAATFLRLV